MNFKSLFDLHLKYIKYLLAKSHFTHQHLKNISLSGENVEAEIRNIMSSILPKRYQVTHGYIVSTDKIESEPVISPQVDMIIVDTLVPHSIFAIDQKGGTEIVPIEAVVGIFEIKRTMDKKSLFGTKRTTGALRHIKNIVEKLKIDKSCKDKLMPTGEVAGGGLNSPYYGNPMLGIISLVHSKSVEVHNLIKWAKELGDEHILDGIDLIFSIEGLLGHTITKGTQDLKIFTYRENESEVGLKFVKTNKNLSQQKIFSFALGIILDYVTLTVGRKTPLNKYYFNKNI